MILNLSSDLALAIAFQAKQRGLAPEVLAEETLRNRFMSLPSAESHEEWMKRLRSMAVDYGVAPPSSAMSSDELYD